jgi:hypothetical protein
MKIESLNSREQFPKVKPIKKIESSTLNIKSNLDRHPASNLANKKGESDRKIFREILEQALKKLEEENKDR